MLFLSSIPTQVFAQDATRIIKKALTLTGGEERWRKVTSSYIEAIGHQYWLEVPERPEGPWPVQYHQYSELRQLEKKQLKRRSNQRWYQIPEWSPQLTILYTDSIGIYDRGNKQSPISPSQIAPLQEWMAFAPERILLDALTATDLKLAKKRSLFGASQNVVEYSSLKRKVNLYFNESTGYLSAVDFTEDHPESPFWSVWGDVTTRFILSYWAEDDSNLVFPRQWHIEKNGLPYQAWTLTKVLWNPPAPPDSFAISDSMRTAIIANKKLPDDLPLNWLAKEPITELVAGVVKISSGFDVAFVKQDDGVVVIEAPTSNGFSKKVIEEISKRYPGSKIKGLISTDQFVAHNAGIREYAARRIPIYTLEVNESFLTQLLKSPHHLRPDSLEKLNTEVKLHPIKSRMKLGTGSNRMELIPLNTPSGERLMAIYFPEHRLLYGSDLFQRFPNGTFTDKHAVKELIEVVNREKLDVTSVFMAHIGVMQWSTVTSAFQ